MKIAKADTQRRLDEQAKQMGIAGILLMEHTALCVKKHMDEAYKHTKLHRIVIVCGPGNNGGDGFALARLLFQEVNYQVQIICHVREEQMSEDERSYANIVKNLGISWYQGSSMEVVIGLLKKADVIIDALYGTGLSRDIIGFDAQIINAINQSTKDVIAIDIPSGLLADSGDIAGSAIVARTTISFVFAKLGMFIKAGITHCGEIKVCDITMPLALQDKIEGISVLDDERCKQRLPKRSKDTHKGSYGKALLVGGSRKMSGAVIMAGKAALRCGLGTLSFLVPEGVGNRVMASLAEAMCIELHDNKGEFEDTAQFAQWEDFDVIAIGNGMGRGEGAKQLLHQALQSNRPCILDGDAFYLLKDNPEWLHRNAMTVVLPHPKELSYLLGIEVSELLKNPVNALHRFEEVYPEVCIVMKNTRTIISSNKQRFINVIGNDGLATGGSGDVLCGMVLGFLSQNKDPLASCGAATYLHAKCADALLERMSSYSILPQDILEVLPQTLKNILEA